VARCVFRRARAGEIAPAAQHAAEVGQARGDEWKR